MKILRNCVKAKRKKPFSANGASIKKLESEGWTVGIVEYQIPHTFIKRDFFGFADLIAVSPARGTMAIQVTGGGNGSTREAKIRKEPRAAIWIATGNRIQVHDWVKRAGQKERECRITEIEKL